MQVINRKRKINYDPQAFGSFFRDYITINEMPSQWHHHLN